MAFNPTTGNYERLEDAGFSRADLQRFFERLSAAYGATIEAGHVDELTRKLMGDGRFMTALGGDPQLAFDEFEAQYIQRGAPTQHRTVDSQSLPSALTFDDLVRERGFLEQEEAQRVIRELAMLQIRQEAQTFLPIPLMVEDPNLRAAIDRSESPLERFPRVINGDGLVRPQVQDAWGRSPGDPEYGKPPGVIGGGAKPILLGPPTFRPGGGADVARPLMGGGTPIQIGGLALSPMVIVIGIIVVILVMRSQS